MDKKQTGSVGIIVLGVGLVFLATIAAYFTNQRFQLVNIQNFPSSPFITPQPLLTTSEEELPAWLKELITKSINKNEVKKCIYQNNTVFYIYSVGPRTNTSGSSLYGETGKLICTPERGGFMGGLRDDRCSDFDIDKANCEQISRKKEMY